MVSSTTCSDMNFICNKGHRPKMQVQLHNITFSHNGIS